MSGEIPQVISSAFETLLSLSLEYGLKPHNVDRLKDAVSHERPLSAGEKAAWESITRFVADSGSVDAQMAISSIQNVLRKLVGRSSSAAGLERYFRRQQSRTVWVTHIALDNSDVPIAATTPLNITDTPVLINALKATILETDSSHVVLKKYAGRKWFILRHPDDPSIRNFVNMTWQETKQDRHIPTSIAFLEGHEFALQADERENIILLRSVLERLDFYATRAVFSKRIHLSNMHPSEAFEFPFVGFAVDEPKKSLVPLFNDPTEFRVGDPQLMRLNRKITPKMARKVLANVKTIAKTLKQMGLAMASWNLLVDPQTGQVYLDDKSLPRLMRAGALSQYLGYLKAIPSSAEEPYIPYLAAFAMDDIDHRLSKAEWALTEMIIKLKQAAGMSYLPTDIDQALALSMEEFRILLEQSRNEKLSDDFENHRDKVRAIFENYFDLLGLNGYASFVISILPHVMMHYDADNWGAITLDYIKEAVAEVAMNEDAALYSYWVEKSMYLQARTSLLVTKDKGKKGGSSSQGSPQTNGSGGSFPGSNTGTLPQAKSDKVAGFDDLSDVVPQKIQSSATRQAALKQGLPTNMGFGGNGSLLLSGAANFAFKPALTMKPLKTF